MEGTGGGQKPVPFFLVSVSFLASVRTINALVATRQRYLFFANGQAASAAKAALPLHYEMNGESCYHGEDRKGALRRNLPSSLPQLILRGVC